MKNVTGVDLCRGLKRRRLALVVLVVVLLGVPVVASAARLANAAWI